MSKTEKPAPVVSIDPSRHDAVLFDLDGVVTDTASVHADAWAQLFDDFLAARAEQPGEDRRPFTQEDYLAHVDGKPRLAGVADFLASRGIHLPEGSPGDPESADTVHGLGSRKNRYFHERLERDGVAVFDSTVDLVRRLRRAGYGTAIFSASRNCRAVLERAGLADLFPVRVDGEVARELGLPGKPAPDVLLEAARRLDARPERAVVVEDATAGAEAGRRGGFALVIGVDRGGNAEALRQHGAHAVVTDLDQVGLGARGRRLSEVPDALEALDELAGALDLRSPALFLDFDGTLSEIVPEPGDATLVPGAAEALADLARRCPVAVVSGRDLADVRQRVGIEELWYAGSHGFELVGPGGEHHEHPDVADIPPLLQQAVAELQPRLEGMAGLELERKRYALAIHYRNAPPELAGEALMAVQEVARLHDRLKVTTGRKVIELRPDVDWDKGKAVLWLLDHVTDASTAMPVYAGDDLTDEDALRAVAPFGLGVVVRSDELGDRVTAAHVAVDSPAELCEWLRRLAHEL